MRRKLYTGPLQVERFLLGAAAFRAAGHDHLSIPIAIHLHTRPIVAAEEYSAVMLGRDRDFFYCVVVHALVCLPASRPRSLLLQSEVLPTRKRQHLSTVPLKRCGRGKSDHGDI